MAVVGDIVRWVYRQVFRRLLVVIGHGGNDPVRGLLAEHAGLNSYQAAWIGAFPFCRVADLPEGVKPPVIPSRILSADEARALYGDGVFGGPYRADGALMDQICQTCVRDLVDRLRFEYQRSVPEHIYQ